MIGHTVGSNNDTHTPFGRAIEIAPGCGNFSEWVQCGNKKIMVCYVASANSAGKDHTGKIVSEVYQDFCERCGVKPSQQGLTILKRFTAVALENSCMLQLDAEGNVVTSPDKKVNGTFYISFESRGNTENDQDTIIKFAYCRGDHQNEASLTTCEGVHKERVNITKKLVSFPYFCGRSSNEHLASEKANEQNQTIGTVTMQLEPGSSVYEAGKQEGKFNEVNASAFAARKTPLEGQTAAAGPYLLAGTNLTTSTFLGLPNTISTVANEINRTTLGLLDYLGFYIGKHLETLFHRRCRGNNLLRLQKVYEARATYFTAWCRMVQYLIQYPDRQDAIARAVNSLQFDALALTDVVGMTWSLVRRCLHWGPILYSCCYMRETEMPIVPLDTLLGLLRRPTPPQDGAAKEWYDRVAAWLRECLAKGRFCQAGERLCEYVSSSGLPDGTVETDGVLRVAAGFNGWRDKMDPLVVQTLLAGVCYKQYGAELAHSCNVSKEVLVCAIDDMLREFSVDIQRFLEVSLFDMERHFAFFGILEHADFQFSERFGEHPYMIRAVWRKVGRFVRARFRVLTTPARSPRRS